MLVLSRRPGERILIGDDVFVEVVRIGPHNVRLGITAPKGKQIWREEILVREPPSPPRQQGEESGDRGQDQQPEAA